jgi:hypothetical protein
VALVDYQITPAGDLHVAHNGIVARTGRKLQLDNANAIVQKLVALGWITTTITGGARYHDDAGNLTTYHVTPAGAGHILHSTSGAATTPLANGAVITLDPQDAGAQSLLARGLIS